MKMKNLFLPFFIASAAVIQAGSVNVGNIGGGGLLSDAALFSSTGQIITSGTVVAGFFATTTDAIVDATPIASLEALFGTITPMTSGTLGSPDAGNFFSGASYAGGLYEANLNKSIYLILFNVGRTEGLLVKTGQSIGADTGTSIDTNDFTLTSTSNILLGTVGPDVTVDWTNALSNAAYTTNSVRMAAIPEPSAAFLGAVGVFGLLRRRRI